MISNIRKALGGPTKKQKVQEESDEELELELKPGPTNEVTDEQEEVKIELPKAKRTSLLDEVRKTTAVWQDEDDSKVEIDISKVARLRKLMKNKEESQITGEDYQARMQEYYMKTLKNNELFKWATRSEKVEDVKAASKESSRSNLERLLAKNEDIVKVDRTSNKTLPDGVVNIKRIAVTTGNEKHNCVVNTMTFHSNSQLLLSAGFDKQVKVLSVTKNQEDDSFSTKLVKSYFMKGLPITKIAILNRYDEVLAAGIKRFLVSVNMVNESVNKISSVLFTSKFNKTIENFAVSPDEDYLALTSAESGFIEVLDSRNKQLLFEFKMNESCQSASFSPDSRYLYSLGDKGKVYQWDMNMRSLVQSFQDIGSFQSTTLCNSPNDMYVACGSASGIVNIYENKGTGAPKHLKEIDNLTTKITATRFNPTSEILAICSKWKNNAVRLVHLPSMSVFSNWPNMKTQTRNVTALEFSPDSKYLALGNEEGNISVYNLLHFNNKMV